MKQLLKYCWLVMLVIASTGIAQAKTYNINVKDIKGDLVMALRERCELAQYDDTVNLYFAAGRYVIDGTIQCKCNVVIKGAGREKSTIVFNHGHNRNGKKAYTSDAFFKLHGTPDHTIGVSISDIAFGIMDHEGILWKEGERYAVKIYHANRVDVHDVNSYLANAYITNFDLHVCSNVSFTNNTITNYNNCETGGCIWLRGEMHNVNVSGNKFYKYGKDETLGIFDNVVDNSSGHMRGVASRTNIVVEDNEFHYGGYTGKDKDPAAVCGMVFSLLTNDLDNSPKCTTSGFHLRNNKFFINDATKRCIFIGFSPNDVHNDINVENNQIINSDIGREWEYYHDDIVVHDQSASTTAINVTGNQVKNSNLVIKEDGTNGYTFLHVYRGNVSLTGNQVVDAATTFPRSGKNTGVRLIWIGGNDCEVHMSNNVFKGIHNIAYLDASKSINNCTLKASNNYFAGNTQIYSNRISRLNINFTRNTLASNSQDFLFNGFAPSGSVVFNNNEVKINGGNGKLFNSRSQSSSSGKTKLDRIEIKNNVFSGVKNEQEMFKYLPDTSKKNLGANVIK